MPCHCLPASTFMFTPTAYPSPKCTTFFFLIVSLLSYLPCSCLPVPGTHSYVQLPWPLGLCLCFLPNLCPHSLAPSLARSLLFTTTSFTTSSPNYASAFNPCNTPINLTSFSVLVFFVRYTLYLLDLSLLVSPCFLFVQCPWGSSPHPCSRCSMPPAGQEWAPWASPSSCWPTTSRSRSQRWMSTTMRWTLSPTSAHDESTGKVCITLHQN